MTEIQKKTLIGCVCAVSCEILFGLSYLFTKKITSDVDAVTLLGWRFLLAFIMMNVLLIAGYIDINIKKKHLPSLLKIAVLQPIAYFTCETFGIQMTTASESGSIIACIPIASLVASIFFYRKTNKVSNFRYLLNSSWSDCLCNGKRIRVFFQRDWLYNAMYGRIIL